MVRRREMERLKIIMNLKKNFAVLIFYRIFVVRTNSVSAHEKYV